MRKWSTKYNQKPTKWHQLDLHMTFEIAILKQEVDKSMKTKETIKRWPISYTHNTLKTSLLNIIWSYWVVINPTLMVDHVWPNIHQVLQTLTTHFSQFDRLVDVILHQHQYLTIFLQSNKRILDSSLEHYGHMLLYQHTKKFWSVTFS